MRHNTALKKKCKMLNNSVVICDSPSKAAKKKAPRKNRKKIKLKTYYESPLKHIQLSSKRWEQIQTQRRVTRSMKKQAKTCMDVETSLQDSVIILSDNESESNEQDSENNSENTAQCTNRETKTSDTEKSKKQSETRKKRKRKSIQVLDNNNTSCLIISDSEESDTQTLPHIDEENIAPSSETTNQGSDDIMVVWTSAKNSESTDQCKTPGHLTEDEAISQIPNDRLFMIDCNRNLNNRKCLKSSLQPATKKRKVDVAKEAEDNKLPFSQAGMKLPDVRKKKKKKNMKTARSDSTSLEQESSNILRAASNISSTITKSDIENSSSSTISTTTAGISGSRIPTSSSSFPTLSTTVGISSSRILPTSSNIPTPGCNIPIPGSNIPNPNYNIPMPSSHTIMPNYFGPHPRIPPWKATNVATVIPKPATLGPYTESLGTATAPLSTSSLNPNTVNTVTTTKLNQPCIQENLLRGQPREIVIDGNNVAMAHTNGKVFSEVGLKLVIDYFRTRGHIVKAFVPQYRRSMNHPLLEELYSQGVVVFTPSRNIGGKRITPYDDRYILEYATVCGGIVVSMDQYRDLYREKPEWRHTIENRLLAPTFVGDYIMFPEDPLGRTGPRLEEFLKF